VIDLLAHSLAASQRIAHPYARSRLVVLNDQFNQFDGIVIVARKVHIERPVSQG